MVFKTFFLILLTTFMCASIHAQYSMGTTGLLNIPTAEMHETGTVMIGGNFLPAGLMPAKLGYNTGNYFANVTLFSFLELCYRMTFIKTDFMDREKKLRQQDRSITIRLRPLKESKHLPGLVIGMDDPYEPEKLNRKSNNYFASAYGTTTKHFTAGGHRLGITAGYYYPLNERSTAHDGVFGGISYTPAFCRPLSVMAEYDSQGFNLGAAAKLFNHVSLHIFTHDFKCVSGGVRYECILIH